MTTKSTRPALAAAALLLAVFSQCLAAPPQSADPRRWVALDRIDQAALPAPHRALLREVQQLLGV